MVYAEPADFRLGTQRSWASGLVLGDDLVPDPLLVEIIAGVASRIEIDLYDDFEPPNPDADETVDFDGTLLERLYLPRRVRSVTSVSTINDAGTVTLADTTSYRVRSSLNASGTALKNAGKRERDYLESLSGFVWPLGNASVRIVGKFGWAAVPWDIKRLLALRVYDLVKATSDPLSRIISKSTADATYTFGPSREAEEIVGRYTRRQFVVV